MCTKDAIAWSASLSKKESETCSKIGKKIPLRSIWLPIIAGILHIHVLYRALTCLLAGRPGQPLLDIDSGVNLYRDIEYAVMSAYCFDIFCCMLSVVPFSRCKKGSEIVMHHMPVILLLLPCGVPMWNKWESWEPVLRFVKSMDEEGRHHAISLLLYANAWGFVSSLNEAIMCFQKAELSLHGFENMLVPRGEFGPKFWTSWTTEFLELSFKLCIFYLFPILSLRSVFRTDMNIFNYHSNLNPSANHMSTLVATYSSPLQLRGIVWRFFIFSFYPTLGKRTIEKIRRFVSEKPKSN